MNKPIIAITMGDPAGIGPEIIIKAFRNKKVLTRCKLLVIGTASILKEYSAEFEVKNISNVSEWSEDGISVIEPISFNNNLEVGVVKAEYGNMAFSYIDHAITLANNGEIDAVVTCPINKEALHLAGHKYPGHTEIFAEKTDTENFTMMFKLGDVSVVHVTTHCSLKEAIELTKKERVLMNIRLLNQALKDLGVKNPRIAVGGLNPHAGENGLFGNEEIEEINPAIAEAKLEGINVSGSFPPDTVFMSAFKGAFDGVVSILHDHGFVALKSRDFENGVNITVGLPIIRTSVGHGTAFDIVGKNIASEESLLSAINDAISMANAKLVQ